MAGATTSSVMYFTPAQKDVLVKHLRAGCNSRKECAEWRAKIGVELGGVDTARIDRWFCNNRGLASDDGAAKPPRATRQPYRERIQPGHALLDSYLASYSRQEQISYSTSPSNYARRAHVEPQPGSYSMESELKRRAHDADTPSPHHWQQHDYPSEKKPKLEHFPDHGTPHQQHRFVLPQLAPLSRQQFKSEAGIPPRLLPGSSAFPQANMERHFPLPSIAAMKAASQHGQPRPMDHQQIRVLAESAHHHHHHQGTSPYASSISRPGPASHPIKAEFASARHAPYPRSNQVATPQLHGRMETLAPSRPTPHSSPPIRHDLHLAPPPLQSVSHIHPRQGHDDEAEVPSAKRGRKTKAAKAMPSQRGTAAPPAVTEKRLARYRTVASQPTQDRIARALHQRMYLIEKTVQSPLHQTFAVLGSTGNIYTVSIELVPSCTCPDFLKGNLCKHILFVWLKCLRLPATSPHVFQKALLTTELQEIFEAASRVDPTVVASQRVVDRYRAATATLVADDNDEADAHGVPQKPLEDSDCPICFEALDDGRPVVWCKDQCGNNIHTECFNQWEKSRRATGVALTCIYCRTPWPSTSAKHSSSTAEGYLNLAAAANMSRRRDTSSYRQRQHRRRWRRSDEDDYSDY